MGILDRILTELLEEVSDPVCLILLLVVVAMYYLFIKKLALLEKRQSEVVEELKQLGMTQIKLTTLLEVLVKGGPSD